MITGFHSQSSLAHRSWVFLRRVSLTPLLVALMLLGAASASYSSAVESGEDPADDSSSEFGAIAEVMEDSQLSAEPDSHPLSVEPSSHLLPKDRPAWISSEPDLDSPVHRFVVQSIPTSVESEVESNLDAPLEESLQAYVDSLFGNDHAGRQMRERLSASFIRKNLLEESKSYVAELQTAVGPVYQKWVMVEVSPKQREQLSLWYAQYQQRQRLTPIGLIALSLISLVAVSHLILRRRCAQIASKATAPQALEVDPASGPARAYQHGMKPTGARPRSMGNTVAMFAMSVAFAIAVFLVVFSASSKGSPDKKKKDRKSRKAMIAETVASISRAESQSLEIGIPSE